MTLVSEVVGRWLLTSARSLKGLKPDEVDADMVEIWSKVLDSEGVTEEELGFAFTDILKHETFFPTPKEVVERVHASRRFVVLIDEGGNSHGRWCLAHKMAETYEDLQREFGQPMTPSLPVTEEQRAEAIERIEKPLAHIAKKRRMKAADLITQDKRIQALPVPTEEEIEEKRALIRRQAGL